MTWTVELYTDERGRSPVDEFFNEIPGKDLAKIAQIIALLRDQGLQLHAPYVKPLRHKLWELRISAGKKAYRVIYFAHIGSRFVLLHAFVKKTQKTPRREMETAEGRLRDFLERGK